MGEVHGPRAEKFPEGMQTVREWGEWIQPRFPLPPR